MIARVFHSRWHRVGTFVGLAFGMASAVVLEIAGFAGGESREGAAILAYHLSFPMSYLWDLVNWGAHASQWVAFIAIGPTLNGVLLGWLLAGAISVMARRGRLRAV
jgi:hypothetical protein